MELTSPTEKVFSSARHRRKDAPKRVSIFRARTTTESHLSSEKRNRLFAPPLNKRLVAWLSQGSEELFSYTQN